MTEKLLKGGPLQTPLNGGQEAVARAQMRRLQMADSWRDGKVEQSARGLGHSPVPTWNALIRLAVDARRFESSAQLWRIKAGEAGSLRALRPR